VCLDAACQAAILTQAKEIERLGALACAWHVSQYNIQQPVRLAGSYRYWFVKKYCWLICVKKKILFRLKIYDRLRQATAKRTGCKHAISD